MVFLGRGGQGVVTSARICATALFRTGFHVQTFPEFGPERAGAPVRAYLRFSRRPIELRTPVERADVAVVLEERLLGFVPLERLVKRESHVVVNSATRGPEPSGAPYRVTVVNASWIAERLGRPRSVGIALLGAMSRAIGVPEIGALEQAVSEHLSPQDAAVARAAYNEVT
ncbi:MAG: 2-oxoacid:acceptor oxidoreductase family protein [Aigarchaeota archaeon]|nr:2-oxoacid:acceptor oxidoreductase family protein [Aigarchaeota archaeon]MCS7127282.1 2-oxoacid:acceptor oxidoreductase family protein [Candidatus Calditenuaceae archaeon]MDW8042927.1 2-oxoacid:acceptor oxidoreductase family protein [Nitrososphaerota archaeon]